MKNSIKKLFICLIVLCFSFTNCAFALTLTKEKETIKKFQIKEYSEYSKGQTKYKNFNFKVSKYKLKNDENDTYQVIGITALDNEKNKKNYELIKHNVFRFDTLISFLFFIVCPLTAYDFIPMFTYDIVMSPVNIGKNINQKKQAKKYTKNIIGTEIEPNKKFVFYTLQDINDINEEMKITLLNKRTKEKIIISGEIKANKSEIINKKIKNNNFTRVYDNKNN